MADLVRRYDWSKTALGSIDDWSESLKVTVSLMLAADTQIVLFGGPEFIAIYNDAYAPTIGRKHPRALGRPAREVWAELWDDLGPLLNGVLETGNTFSAKNRPFYLERSDVGETVYFDVSYSAVRNSRGKVEAILCIVNETTEQVIAEKRLRESEERFRALVNASSDVVYQMSSDWQQMRQLDGRGFLTDTSAPTIRWLDEYIFPEDHPQIVARIDHAIKHRDTFEMEHRVRQANGAVGWTFSRAIPIFDDEGSIREWFGMASDVTARKTSEEALRASEDRFQMALSAGNGIGTWDWDVVADRVIADARFASLYNVDPELAKAGAPIAAFFRGIHGEDSERVQAEVARAIKTGDPFVSEYRLVQSDGSVRWVVAHGRCMLSPDGRPLRFPGASFDITDRKRAEERLRELNSDLERQVVERSSERGTTWQVSPHLLSVIDLGGGKFLRVNPAWKEALGWSEAEMVGASYGNFLHPDDIAPSQAAFEDVMRGIPVLDFENRYRAKDGAYRWLSWVAVPEDGRLYSTARDITAEKQRAEALAAAEDSLRQSQKMEAVGQLTGGLAHDFNNLLTGISGSLQMLQMRIAQGRMDAVERYISVAQGAVKRAASLTHRLLAFSRRQTLDAKPTNVNRLIAGMEDLIRRTVGPSIHIEVVGAGGLWLTLVDPNQLENALLNLCINAKDAMPEGGRLTIETANKWLDERAAKQRDLTPGQYVSLCVTDTGTGMTPDVISHAFDPFFTTKPFGEGTGLGLSMIYGFARQSGGQIRIYSEVGRGTTMCLYLPRHDSEDISEDLSAANTRASATGHGEVVLVIDDEPSIRMLIAEVLEEQGYASIEASDGPSGMRVLESSVRIDLLITDVGLPNGMNGRQIADAALALRPGLKVLFITGYAENAVLGNGQLGKGMQVIAKPFDMELLADKIRELIGTSAA